VGAECALPPLTSRCASRPKRIVATRATRAKRTHPANDAVVVLAERCGRRALTAGLIAHRGGTVALRRDDSAKFLKPLHRTLAHRAFSGPDGRPRMHGVTPDRRQRRGGPDHPAGHGDAGLPARGAPRAVARALPQGHLLA
jgi:hypothetical protein